MTDPRYPIGRFIPPSALDSTAREDCISRIAATPAQLRAAVAGLTEPQLRTAYRDGGWSVAQVVHHLPDSHMNSYCRFKLAVTEDDPTIKPYNEVRWAELPDASATDLHTSLTLLEALHERWVVFLRSLTTEQWDRTFQHPERGPSSLSRTLALYAWHGDHHVAHITTLRANRGW
jgi:hypothetical protein